MLLLSLALISNYLVSRVVLDPGRGATIRNGRCPPPGSQTPAELNSRDRPEVFLDVLGEDVGFDIDAVADAAATQRGQCQSVRN